MTRTASKPPASERVAPAEAARFLAELERLCPEGGCLGLAVSGGPDSLALLLLAHAAIPDRIAVATVNHGLRPAAAGECATVAQVCATRDIACTVLEIETGTGNVQAAARTARYAALAAWAESEGLTALATAHHADDQAETLVMRLNRASGLAGLAGVRARGAVPGVAAAGHPAAAALAPRRAGRDRCARRSPAGAGSEQRRCGLRPRAHPSGAGDRRLARSRGDRRERRTSCRGRRGDRVDGRTRDG